MPAKSGYGVTGVPFHVIKGQVERSQLCQHKLQKTCLKQLSNQWVFGTHLAPETPRRTHSCIGTACASNETLEKASPLCFFARSRLGDLQTQRSHLSRGLGAGFILEVKEEKHSSQPRIEAALLLKLQK